MIDQDSGVLRLIAGCEHSSIVFLDVILWTALVLKFTKTSTSIGLPEALWIRREK